jgi:hypothetical protein
MSLEKPRKMRNKSATNAVRQPERNFQDPATTHNKTPTNCNFLPDVGLFFLLLLASEMSSLSIHARREMQQ